MSSAPAVMIDPDRRTIQGCGSWHPKTHELTRSPPTEPPPWRQRTLGDHTDVTLTVGDLRLGQPAEALLPVMEQPA